MVRRSQLHVVLEEQSDTLLLHPLDLYLVQMRDLLWLFLPSFLLLLLLAALLDLLGFFCFLDQARVLRADHALNLRKFPCLVGFTLWKC